LQLFSKLNGLKDYFISKKAENKGNFDENQLFKQLYDMMGVNTRLSPNELKTYINEGYILNPHIYTVINKIIKPASSVPFLVYEVKKDSQKEFKRYKAALENNQFEKADYYAKKSLEVVNIKELTNLFEHPNEKQSHTEFLEECLAYRLITGNEFIYGLSPIGFQEDLFTKIYCMPSQLVSIELGNWQTPVKGYNVNYFGYSSDLIAPEKVCHIKNLNPSYNSNNFLDLNNLSGQSADRYGLYGLSPMSSLCRVVQKSNDNLLAQMRLIQNGHPLGIFSSDSERGLTKEEALAAEKAYYAKFGGANNKGKAMFTNANLKWLNLGLNSVDMQLLDSDKADLESIARVYGVPLPLMLNDASTFNNLKEAQRQLWEGAIIPLLNSHRDGLNRWLIQPYANKYNKNLYLDYDISHIQSLKQDEKEQVEILAKEIESGILSPNEAREIRGREKSKDPLMDKIYIKGNLRPLDEPYKPINEKGI
jgi:HK97 family phage portal protein